ASGYRVLAEIDPSLNDGRKEVAFIDSRVTDWQSLAEDARPGIEVVLLDGEQDGLSQMAGWARQHTGYDAIHVLSHGSEGRVQLGALTLDADAVEDRAEDLTALGSALTQDGDLLLYGCWVAD